MNIGKQQLDEILLKINSLIENNLVDEACGEYIEAIKKIENEEYCVEKSIKAEFYASFAFFLFDVSEYESALNMFIKAQNYGYSKTEIKKVMWQAFIEPNLDYFKETYKKNIEFLLSNKYILNAVDFDDLSFWLIPTLIENEYYIYDKNEEVIKEKICFNDNCNKYSSITSLDKFSDFLIVEDYDFNRIQPYVNSIKRNNKKSYIVINDYTKFLSFFQGMLTNSETISDLLIFNGFNNIKEYFKECSDYIPRNVINLTKEIALPQRTIDEIHNYRITKEGRKGDNILLSICIPSYNRGKRAYDNVIHSLQCYYDEEIEIVLSNNGTQNETKEYYTKISEIDDSRLNYFDFKENQGFALNVCKVAEMAKGKFFLCLSDEDTVNLNTLPKIMNMLNSQENSLSIMRTRGDGQGFVPSFRLAKAGSDALFTYMLTSNYMSGIIFNNKLLKKYNGIEYVKQNLDNSVCLYYPHMFWDLLLCQYGNVQGSDIILINEGEAESTDIGVEDKCKMPKYSSIEGRLEQHKSFYEIFKDLEVCKNDFSVFREMYIKLSGKTIFLVALSINVFYKNTDMNLFELIQKAYDICIEYLDEIYHNRKKNNLKKCYIEDMENIKHYYEYYKNQI